MSSLESEEVLLLHSEISSETPSIELRVELIMGSIKDIGYWLYFKISVYKFYV